MLFFWEGQGARVLFFFWGGGEAPEVTHSPCGLRAGSHRRCALDQVFFLVVYAARSKRSRPPVTHPPAPFPPNEGTRATGITHAPPRGSSTGCAGPAPPVRPAARRPGAWGPAAVTPTPCQNRLRPATHRLRPPPYPPPKPPPARQRPRPNKLPPLSKLPPPKKRSTAASRCRPARAPTTRRTAPPGSPARGAPTRGRRSCWTRTRARRRESTPFTWCGVGFWGLGRFGGF